MIQVSCLHVVKATCCLAWGGLWVNYFIARTSCSCVFADHQVEEFMFIFSQDAGHEYTPCPSLPPPQDKDKASSTTASVRPNSVGPSNGTVTSSTISPSGPPAGIRPQFPLVGTLWALLPPHQHTQICMHVHVCMYMYTSVRVAIANVHMYGCVHVHVHVHVC